MPLVAAQCTQCGANLTIDNSTDAAVCPHCKTAFITEKAINNYNTYNKNTYEIQNANILINDEKSIENRLKNAEVFWATLNDSMKARSLFEEVTNDAPGDYRGWWGLARICTNEFTNFEFQAYIHAAKYVAKAFSVAEPSEYAAIKNTWANYAGQLEPKVYTAQQQTAGAQQELTSLCSQQSNILQELSETKAAYYKNVANPEKFDKMPIRLRIMLVSGIWGVLFFIVICWAGFLAVMNSLSLSVMLSAAFPPIALFFFVTTLKQKEKLKNSMNALEAQADMLNPKIDQAKQTIASAQQYHIDAFNQAKSEIETVVTSR